MAIFVETSDPRSQVESRGIPLDNGLIGEETEVRIPTTLYRRVKGGSIEAQRVFDHLVMAMSHVFPFWKGTRADFRFADAGQTRVLVLTPKIQFVRVEVRTDATGYRVAHHLFSDTAPEDYPGDWARANVADIRVARAIAEDVGHQLRAHRE